MLKPAATSMETSRQPVLFADNFSLLLKLIPPDFSRDYEVMVIFTTGLTETNLKYELRVTYLRTEPKGGRIFKIERTGLFYINHEAPETTVDQLALKSATVFYPLLVEIDFDGSFISVFNQSEIIDRWPVVKENVQDYFVGAVTDRYLELMEKGLFDLNTLNERFKNDPFIRTYFAAIYKSYTPELEVTAGLTFCLNGHNTPIHFMTKQQVDPDRNEDGEVQIHHQAVLNEEKLEGDYTATYVLNPNTRAIERVLANWNLKDVEVTSTEVRIFRTDADRQEPPIESPGYSSMVYLD